MITFFSLPLLFFDWCNFCTHFSQGSVATCFGCGGIVNVSFVGNFSASAIEKILKIC